MAEFRTTKKHFKLFKSECERWLQTLGLIDWDVYYSNETDLDGNWAWAAPNIEARIVTLGLSREWGRWKPTKRRVREVAFHEVCELLIAPLDAEARARYANEARINETRHEIIRVLEKVIWEAGARKR